MNEAALHDEVMHVRANMDTSLQLGIIPEFKNIRIEALKFGMWICSNMVCLNPVKDLAEFVLSGSQLPSQCKECRNQKQNDQRNGRTSESKRAKKKRKAEVSAKVNAREVKRPTHETEDEVMKNFLVPVLSQEFEVEVMPEARRSDMVAKCPNGKYIQIQLKTDGAYHKDGTPKPDNSTRKKGERGTAIFHHTSKYEMPVIPIKSRLVGEIMKRCIWFEHGSKITTSALNEHPDGTLGPSKIPQVDVPGLIDRIREMMKQEENHVSFIDAWLDVRKSTHFKEVANIQALQTAYNVNVPRQNQQAFDCFFDKRRIQVKTYNVKSGKASLNHSKNGILGQPYSSDDPIDAFCFPCIIACEVNNETWYFLLYCEIGMDVMIKNKAVSDIEEGITVLYLHPGVYEQMLSGRRKKTTKKTAWLDAYLFKHVRLYEHTEQNPQVHKLTKEKLEMVAQDVSDPNSIPACMLN